MKYQLLSDHQMKAAQAFGIAFKVDDDTLKKLKGFGIDLEDSTGQKHHQLPVPAVFLVDTKRIIQFQYVNPDYRVRLNSKILLTAAEELKTGK